MTHSSLLQGTTWTGSAILLPALSTDDVIALSGFGASFDTFAEVFAAATESGGNTIIDFGNGDMLTLLGVDKIDLHQDDFLFG